MKKLFILFALSVFFINLPAKAIVVDNTKDGQMQQYITEIGLRLLNANRIPYRMNFVYNPNKKVVNARTSYSNKTVTIYNGLILYANNEDEIAAVLGHEISHGCDFNDGIFRGFFTFLPYVITPKKYEYMADKRSVDYLVKAGYNPIALIVIMNKILSQPRYDWYSTHPHGSKRLAKIYEYIYLKYPEYLVDNRYKDNLSWQNFLLTSRKDRLKLQKKVQTKLNKNL